MKNELNEAVKGIFKTIDRSKYNSSIGFFQCYNTEVEADSLNVRFADIKLHYKDDNGDDISGTVPLVYPGSKNTILDFRLEKGDQLLVFFTDRTLEQWKDETGTSPQSLKNPVKDSINHGIAIPICSHHNSAEITTSALPSEVGVRMAVKSGKKAQIGTDTDDLLKIMYDVVTEFKTLVGATLLAGNVDSVGVSSTGTNSLILAGLATMESNITALQTKLANITKI